MTARRLLDAVPALGPGREMTRQRDLCFDWSSGGRTDRLRGLAVSGPALSEPARQLPTTRASSVPALVEKAFNVCSARPMSRSSALLVMTRAAGGLCLGPRTGTARQTSPGVLVDWFRQKRSCRIRANSLRAVAARFAVVPARSVSPNPLGAGLPKASSTLPAAVET